MKKSVSLKTLRGQLVKIEGRIGQANLARILNISPRSIRRYKAGTRKPRPDILKRLGMVSGVVKLDRKTKSIKRKKLRAERIIEKRPDLRHAEKMEHYLEAGTIHHHFFDIDLLAVPSLITYLISQGVESAYFIVHGVDTKTGDKRILSTEVYEIHDFERSWNKLYSDLIAKYNFAVVSIDLIGKKSYQKEPLKRK